MAGAEAAGLTGSLHEPAAEPLRPERPEGLRRRERRETVVLRGQHVLQQLGDEELLSSSQPSRAQHRLRRVEHLGNGTKAELLDEEQKAVPVPRFPRCCHLERQHVAGRGDGHQQPHPVVGDVLILVHSGRQQPLDAVVQPAGSSPSSGCCAATRAAASYTSVWGRNTASTSRVTLRAS